MRDTVRREASLGGVGTDHLFVGRDVDAVNRVGGHIAVQPLDLRPETIQNTATISARDRALDRGLYFRYRQALAQ